MSAVTVAINLIATDGTSSAFSGFSTSMAGAAARLQGFRGLLKDISPEMLALGAALVGSAAAFELFKIPVQHGIEAAAELEQNLLRLRFATQDSADDMPLLTAAVNDLAVQTMFGVGEATQAFERLVEMGFNTQQIMYGMDDSAVALMDGTYHAKEAMHGLGMESLFLGQALKADATDAAQLLGAVLHTFSGDEMDAAEAANYLAAAFFNGVPDVNLLAQAIRNGGSTAATLKVPFKDFAITLDLLSQSGLSANQAATSLNYYLSQLAAPTMKAAKAMSDLGIITLDNGPKMAAFESQLRKAGTAGAEAVKGFDGSVTSLQNMFTVGQALGLIPLDKTFMSWAVQSGLMKNSMFDANGQFIGMKDSILTLQGALEGMPDGQRLSYIRDIFNIRGGQDARLFSSMDDFAQKYDQLTDRFNGTDLGQLAADQLNTLSGAVDQLKDTFNSALATAFLPLLPVITDFVHSITDLVSEFQNADPQIKTAVAVFLLVGAIFFGITTLILGIIVAIAGLLAILGTLGIGWEAVAIGLGAVAAVIGVIALVIAGVVAFKDLVANNPQIQEFFKKIGDFIGFLGEVWGQVWAVLGPTLADMGHFFGDVLGKNLDMMGQTLQGVLIPAWQNLQDSFANLAPLAGPALDVLKAIATLIGTVLVVAIGYAIGVITGIISAIITFVMGVVTFVSGLITVISGFFQIFVGLWQIVAGTVMAIVTGHFDKIGEIILGGLNTIWNGVKTIFGGLLTMILGLFQAVFGTIIAYVGGFITGIISFFTHLFDVLVGHSIIPDLVNSIIDWFLSLGVKVLSAINLLVNWVLSSIRSWVAGILKLVNDMVDGFLGFISSLPLKVDKSITDLVNNTRTLVTDLKNIGLDAGKGLVQNLISGITNMLGNLKSKISDVASIIKLPLGHSVPEEGPLSDDDQWGAHLIENLIGGMDSRLPELARTVNRVAGTVRGSLTTPQFAASAGNGGTVVIPIIFDGKQVAEYTLDMTSKQLRKMGSTRYAR